MKIPEDVKNILDRNPALTMRIYSMFDDKEENIQYFTNKSAIIVHSWGLGIYAEEIDDLLPLLPRVPETNNIFLNGIPIELLPFLEEVFPKIIVTDPCHIWTLEEPPMENSPLESLIKQDAPFINQNWSYRRDDSLWYISHRLENYPSSVIRDEKNKPAGWAFTYSKSPYHVNMGGLLVLPPFRRLGYARKITMDLSSKIFQLGKKPIVHVNITNIASQNLLESLGFARGEEVFFGKILFE